MSEKKDVLGNDSIGAWYSADSSILILTLSHLRFFCLSIDTELSVVCLFLSLLSHPPSSSTSVFRPSLMFYSELLYYIFGVSTTAGEVCSGLGLKGKFSGRVIKH